MIKRISIEFEFSSEQVLNLFNHSDGFSECARNIKDMITATILQGEKDEQINLLAEQIINSTQEELEEW